MNTQLSEIVSNSILNDNQKDFFAQNGYIGPFSLPDRSLVTVTHLRHSLENLPENARKLFMPQRVSHIISKPIFKLTAEPSILDGVSSLLGPDILIWVAEQMRKRPNGIMTPWHIDQTNYLVGGVHVSIAITDMNVNNGCLEVIPGTHKYKDDLQAYVNQGECDPYNSESIVQLADRLHPENAPHQIVPVEMKAGQYFFTKGGVWHCARANQTEKLRLALVARYMRTDICSAKARNSDCSLPSILVRGEDNYQLNTLYKPPLSKLQTIGNAILLLSKKYRR